MLVDNAIKSQ